MQSSIIIIPNSLLPQGKVVTALFQLGVVVDWPKLNFIVIVNDALGNVKHTKFISKIKLIKMNNIFFESIIYCAGLSYLRRLLAPDWQPLSR